MYERGLQALQRRDFAASADALRTVIERYPDERELLERARLYLKVCERELEPKEPAPKTADEWVYAATVGVGVNRGVGTGGVGASVVVGVGSGVRVGVGAGVGERVGEKGEAHEAKLAGQVADGGGVLRHLRWVRRSGCLC